MTEIERLLGKAAAERKLAEHCLQGARMYLRAAARTERQAAALLGGAGRQTEERKSA